MTGHHVTSRPDSCSCDTHCCDVCELRQTLDVTLPVVFHVHVTLIVVMCVLRQTLDVTLPVVFHVHVTLIVVMCVLAASDT